MIKILFVCHGNICRSPMAEFVMKDLVAKAGLSQRFHVASAATSREELGNPVHHGTRKKLAEHGISCAGKTARQMTAADYQDYDLLIGMDNANLRNMNRICGGDPEGKLSLLLDWAGQAPARVRAQNVSQNGPRPGGSCGNEVADPWYTRDFDATWRDISEGCRGLLQSLELL